MKLRNKKTEIVGELHYEPDKEYHFTVATEDPADMAIYRTLAELNAKWEDYTPKEPLIEDNKIRKAVRAWAEANEVNEVIMAHSLEYDEYLLYTNYGAKIKFNKNLDIKGGSYTIAELCGEDEE